MKIRHALDLYFSGLYRNCQVSTSVSEGFLSVFLVYYSERLKIFLLGTVCEQEGDEALVQTTKFSYWLQKGWRF